MTGSTPPSPGRAAAAAGPRWCVVGRRGDGWSLVDIGAGGDAGSAVPVSDAELPAAVAERERARAPRWVWCDTPHVYAPLLAAGVRVARCHDLRLAHQILRHAAAAGGGPAARELRSADEWNAPPRAAPVPPAAAPGAPMLFDDVIAAAPEPGGVPESVEAALAEFERQRAALGAASPPSGLARLVAAESAGALVAAELTAAGLPWDADEHDRILAAELGPRPPLGVKPERMQRIGADVRRHLGAPDAPLDSPPRLLRVLQAAGIDVASTSRWELREHEHPAIAPLLEYKKLSRLLTANGWAWLDDWVRDGRYRPVYVPGGVVTGRWASSGGGALQIPRMLRPAIRADPGWVLVSADVAQLEPRVLAAMAGDRAMAAAGSGKDLYAGIVESGAVATREEAKYAVLGAMYGATSGTGGRLVPRLRRAFPAAMRLVDDAAERGAAGGTVSTWLGRSSPAPGAEWNAVQSAASLPGASARDEALARRLARERGRFTRNFVVQGTAAEWALCWLAELRTRLAGLDAAPADRTARASGAVFARRPHLAFFLHDEVIVHAPLAQADAVSSAIEESARAAGRLLFGDTPVEFPLDLRASERAGKS